ncbi:MAG: hypothetical protein EXR75_17275, partial [Myxococcales bacterium]|nr:hypothetical protein [Myxococcales bacterium]
MARPPRFLTKGRLRTLLLFAVVTVAWAVALPRMRVDMSIAHFLPETQDPRLAGILRALAESDMASTTVVDIEGGDEDGRVATARALMEKLGTLGDTKEARSGFAESEERALFDFFAQYPPSAFLPTAAFDGPALAERVLALKTELGGPMGPVVRLTAPRDPLGASLGVLQTLRREQGGATISRNGVLLTEDGAHAFVFVTPRGNAFDADVQRRSLAEVTRVFEEVKATKDLHFELSGVSRYTIHSEEHIRGDISRIGTVSTLGILVLFGVMFRSPRMLLLGLVPIFFGSMVATLGCYLIFGRVHGLTIAFGTSLLGVGIDYAEHYYAHFALEPEVGALPMMKRVWPGLYMGALTTVAGLIGLAWADFPGALQMAVFSALAVLGALVGTRLLMPPWMPVSYTRPPLPAKLECTAERLLAVLSRYRRWPWLPVALTLLTGFGLLRLRFSDDMNALLDMDPAIIAEDVRVRDRLTHADPGRFAVVIAADEERALADLSLAHDELVGAEKEGIVGHFIPLGAILRSARAQGDSLALAKSRLPDLRAALAKQGFHTELFAPYESALEHPEKTVVTLEDVLRSPMGKLVRPLAPHVGSQQAFVMPLTEVHSLTELRRRVPHALIVDETTLLADTYGHVRGRVMSLIVLGLVFVFGLLYARY